MRYFVQIEVVDREEMFINLGLKYRVSKITYLLTELKTEFE